MNKLIVANWKMNPQSQKEAESLFLDISKVVKIMCKKGVIVCPPSPFLFLFKKLKIKNIALGGQNISEEIAGAYTGQVSAKMFRSLGAIYVVLGHSESRKAGDTNRIINKKISIALKSKLLPILCIGESDRDSHGGYLTFIKNELHECLVGVAKTQMKNIAIAYEPIWAIGEHATREATVEEFTEIKIFIRKVISDMFDAKTAHIVQVIYGGSVHPENAGVFIKDGGADGFIIGRDSLNAKKFAAILASL